MTASTTTPAALNAATNTRLRPEHPRSSAPLPNLPAWTITGEIARGETSALYRARPQNGPENSPADFAIKLLFEGVQRHRKVQFCREAWIGRHVKQEHLIPVFSSRIEPGPAYLVMPFLSGVNLAAVLAHAKQIHSSRAVWIARQTTEALVALHAAGWLHGDLKPANLMLSREGHATLIDLGFARKTETAHGTEGPLMGSVAYAAPELFTADPVGTAADIYSLAITLFEAITGRLPYDGQSPDELATAHMQHTPADIREFDPLVPQELAWLMRRALSKQPLRRPSAEEMRDGLAACEIELLNQWFQTQ